MISEDTNSLSQAAWVTSDSIADIGFDDSFASVTPHVVPSPLLADSLPVAKLVNSAGFVSSNDYAKKLEQRLKKLQNPSNVKCGKEMLSCFIANKESAMQHVIDNDETRRNNPFGSHNNETFLERLYNTNSLYRHINPQQAMDSLEKEPIVKYDVLQTNMENDDVIINK